jgi:hypothetical protein
MHNEKAKEQISMLFSSSSPSLPACDLSALGDTSGSAAPHDVGLTKIIL